MRQSDIVRARERERDVRVCVREPAYGNECERDERGRGERE